MVKQMLQSCESFICNFMRLAHQKKKIHMVSSLGFQQELHILWRGKKQKRDYYLFWPIQLLSRLIIYVLAQKQHILNADQNTFFFFPCVRLQS